VLIRIRRKQFDYNLRKWGIFKNTRGASERQGLLDRVDAGEVTVDETFGMVKVSSEKVKRWGKQVLGTRPESKPPSQAVRGIASTLEELPEDTTFAVMDAENTSSDLFQLPSNLETELENEDIHTEFPRQDPQTLWDSAKIQTSPTLTTLLLAMDIDDETPLPPPAYSHPGAQFVSMADLADQGDQFENGRKINYTGSSISTQKKSKAPEIDLSLFRKVVEGFSSPLFEPSPFPRPLPKRKKPFSSDQNSDRSLQSQIDDCRQRLNKLQKTLQNPDNFAIISQIEELAGLYTDHRQYEPAELFYIQALKMRRKHLGADNVKTVHLILDTITNKIHWGKLKEAEELHQGVNAEIVRRFGQQSDLGIRSLDVKSMIAWYSKKFEVLEILAREMLQIALNRFGLHDFRTLEAMAHMAVSMKDLSATGHPMSRQLLASSEDLFRRIVRTEPADLVDSNVVQLNRANDFCWLGSCLLQGGDYQESVLAFRECIKVRQEIYGFGHTGVLRVYIHLAECFRKIGLYVESERLSRLSLLSITKLGQPGFNHNGLGVAALEEMMRCSEALEQWGEASLRAEELYRVTFVQSGEDHEHTSKRAHDLRNYYKSQELYKEDSKFQDRLIEVREKGEFTTIHTEKRRDETGRLGDEIEQLQDWFNEWLEEPETHKKRKMLQVIENADIEAWVNIPDT